MQIVVIATGQLLTRQELQALVSVEGTEVCLPNDLTDVDLTEFGAAVVAPSEPPEAPAGQVATISGAENREGVWRWKWSFTDAPPPPVPYSVKPLQIRKALRAAGMMDQVKHYLENYASEEEAEEWDFASTIDRDNATLNAAAASLGLTSSAIDGLFVLADTFNQSAGLDA